MSRRYDAHSSTSGGIYCLVWCGAGIFACEFEEGAGKDSEVADYERDPDPHGWKSEGGGQQGGTAQLKETASSKASGKVGKE